MAASFRLIVQHCLSEEGKGTTVQPDAACLLIWQWLAVIQQLLAQAMQLH
jgi:hypothetical protein